MVTSTIAAVFGFLEIFGLGMIIGERVEDYFKFKLSKGVNIQIILEAREKIIRSFEYKISLKKNKTACCKKFKNHAT